MGQYWLVVNLDKKEFIDPHKLGAGLKLWEQLANHPGTGAALIVLLAAEREQRGGGDLDIDVNWHGPEREFPKHNITPGPMPEGYILFDKDTHEVKESTLYPDIARRTIGRWAGDRIAIVGDYAEDSDLPDSPVPASKIYDKCIEGEFKDISDDVCRVIEHELHGKFVGDGWREFKVMEDENDSC